MAAVAVAAAAAAAAAALQIRIFAHSWKTKWWSPATWPHNDGNERSAFKLALGAPTVAGMYTVYRPPCSSPGGICQSTIHHQRTTDETASIRIHPATTPLTHRCAHARISPLPASFILSSRPASDPHPSSLHCATAGPASVLDQKTLKVLQLCVRTNEPDNPPPRTHAPPAHPSMHLKTYINRNTYINRLPHQMFHHALLAGGILVNSSQVGARRQASGLEEGLAQAEPVCCEGEVALSRQAGRSETFHCGVERTESLTCSQVSRQAHR